MAVEKENSNISWAKAVTGSFDNVNKAVESLDSTVREHTKQRRRDQVWMSVMIVVVTIFSILELINLIEARQIRSSVEEVACESASDVRNILVPIMEETGLDPELPPVPEQCRR